MCSLWFSLPKNNKTQQKQQTNNKIGSKNTFSIFPPWVTFEAPSPLFSSVAPTSSVRSRSKLQRQQDLCSLKYCTHPRVKGPSSHVFPRSARSDRRVVTRSDAASANVHSGHYGWFINQPVQESSSVSRIKGEGSKRALFPPPLNTLHSLTSHCDTQPFLGPVLSFCAALGL